MGVKNKSTEDKIIDASFRVLERDGVSGTTTKKIADEAGVSEVTIFRKFKNKENLLTEAKEYYTEFFLSRLDVIFDYDEEISLKDYLFSIFITLVNLPNDELNLLKIALEEIRDIPFENKVLSKVAKKIIGKLTGFFDLQIEKGEIRDINTHVISLSIFSIIFESAILWKIYGNEPKYDVYQYFDDFLDIILNGISVK